MRMEGVGRGQGRTLDLERVRAYELSWRLEKASAWCLRRIYPDSFTITQFEAVIERNSSILEGKPTACKGPIIGASQEYDKQNFHTEMITAIDTI